MKNAYLLLILLISNVAYSQQDLYIGNDALSPAWYNPASFGSWNKFSVNTIQQIYNKNNAGDPRNFIFVSDAKFKYGKSNFSSGAGFNFNLNESLWERHAQVAASFNFQLSLKNVRVSIGASPGIHNSSTGLVGFAEDKTTFTLGSGLMIYNAQFYVGFSSADITSPFSEQTTFSFNRGYYGHAGCRFKIHKKIILFPTLQFVSVSNFSVLSTMVYAQLTQPKITAGIGYSTARDWRGSISYEWKHLSFTYLLGKQSSFLTNAEFMLQEFRLSFKLPDKLTCATCSKEW
jgi:hypothetical protein